MKSRKLLKNRWLTIVGAFILGALLILVIRFTTYSTPNQKVHYHANFAVYVNGQRQQFNNVKYYEETSTATCSVQNAAAEADNPMARVHMHGNVNDVVHIEDQLVSWGNFFNVLGWGVGKNYLATDNQVLVPDSQSQLTFILNGKPVSDASNRIIGDQDKLLVNYGNQSANQIKAEYSGIKNKAFISDTSKDPAACGSNEKSVTTFRDRITHMF